MSTSSVPIATRPRRRSTFRLKAPVVAEHPLQVGIAKVLTIEIAAPGRVSRHGVCWYAIDHAQFSGEVPGVRIGRGIIAGILDTFIIWRGRAHMIEIKTDVGKLSEAQMSMAASLMCSGGRVGIARNADEVLALVDEWGIPRKGMIRTGQTVGGGGT